MNRKKNIFPLVILFAAASLLSSCFIFKPKCKTCPTFSKSENKSTEQNVQLGIKN